MAIGGPPVENLWPPMENLWPPMKNLWPPMENRFEWNNIVVHTWEYIGSQREYYHLYWMNEGK